MTSEVRPPSSGRLAGPGGRVIATRVRWARSRRARRKGLLDLPALRPGDALVIERGSQVHTFGMDYAIDVVFCNKNWEVRRVFHGVQPRRLTGFVFLARYVIELPERAAEGLSRGDRLMWITPASGTPD